MITAAGWEIPWDTRDVRSLNDELHAAARRAAAWADAGAATADRPGG
ncbi:hypothetical protein [Tsukamurella soli]